MLLLLSRILLLLPTSLVLLCAGPGHAEPVTYFYSDLPPYEFSNPQGQAEGVGIDQVRKVLTAAGFAPDFRFYSLQRGLNALQQDIDFTAVVAPSGQQAQQFHLSRLPVYAVELGVVRLRTTKRMSYLSQLQHYPYLALSETRFAFLQQRPELAAFAVKRYDISNQPDAFRLLLSGRYDYFLCYHASEMALANPLLVFDALEQLPVHLVLSRQHAEAARLMQRVDAVLARPLQ
ncbi:MAG: transporter substrate-binding domain-containing protein [Rheinheimera sp.]|nr:transporter substrate-binding domain-containing protein [Rheinheimera sp.]